MNMNTTENIFSSNKILYYPNIEFNNDGWLKQALTIWDEVYRIVPSAYIPNDSPEVQIAVQEKVVKNININDKDLKDTATLFDQFCKGLKSLPDGLEIDLNIRLHKDKIDGRLQPFIKSLSAKLDSQGFYHIPESIAHAYMVFLSDVICKRRNIQKLTDNPDMHTVMTYISSEGAINDFVYPTENENVQSHIILSTLLPKNIETVGIDKVLRLSEKLKDSKTELREKLADFSEELSKCEDWEFAIDHVEKFKTSLSGIQKTRFGLLKDFSKELTTSMLYVGIPTTVAALAPDGWHKSSIENLFTGFAIFGVASMTDAGNMVRKHWSKTKNNYFLNLQTMVKIEAGMVPTEYNFTKAMDDFIND